MRSRRRHGFSLLEVLLAMAILVGSLVVLSDLATIGRIHATKAADGTTAMRICRSKLNEIIAGLEPVAPVRDEPLDGEPGWLYSVEVESLQQPGLVSVRVTVRQEESENGRPLEFSLVRWIRDPRQASGGRSSLGDGLRLSPGFRGRRFP
jgi:general secretion pathway protein I